MGKLSNFVDYYDIKNNYQEYLRLVSVLKTNQDLTDLLDTNLKNIDSDLSENTFGDTPSEKFFIDLSRTIFGNTDTQNGIRLLIAIFVSNGGSVKIDNDTNDSVFLDNLVLNNYTVANRLAIGFVIGFLGIKDRSLENFGVINTYDRFQFLVSKIPLLKSKKSSGNIFISGLATFILSPVLLPISIATGIVGSLRGVFAPTKWNSFIDMLKSDKNAIRFVLDKKDYVEEIENPEENLDVIISEFENKRGELIDKLIAESGLYKKTFHCEFQAPGLKEIKYNNLGEVFSTAFFERPEQMPIRCLSEDNNLISLPIKEDGFYRKVSFLHFFKKNDCSAEVKKLLDDIKEIESKHAKYIKKYNKTINGDSGKIDKKIILIKGFSLEEISEFNKNKEISEQEKKEILKLIPNDIKKKLEQSITVLDKLETIEYCITVIEEVKKLELLEGQQLLDINNIILENINEELITLSLKNQSELYRYDVLSILYSYEIAMNKIKNIVDPNNIESIFDQNKQFDPVLVSRTSMINYLNGELYAKNNLHVGI